VSGSALLTTNRLLFASSNLDASFDDNPGTVIAFTYDPLTKGVTNPVAFQTTDFNPTALTRVKTSAGDVVLVTNTGLYGAGPSSIDIIDPATLNFVGTIPLGARNAGGAVVVSPDGRRGYVASSGAAEVFVLDLERLGDELANTAKKSLPARFLGGWTLPASSAMGYVSGLALSHTGNYLYAVNFNGSELFVLDLASPGVAARVTGFARTGNPASFEGLASKVVVRPGVPGTDFTGPSLFVATINLATADRTIVNVKTVLDAVTVDRH
jgi:DNA-binding beta-propeller fold protein YncE